MSRLRQALPWLLLALLPALFFWRLTLAGRIMVGLDPLNFFYPYHDAVRAALAAGRLPAWNPALFGGVPLLADSQAQVFYPPNWILLLFDAPTALTWGAVSHLALAALGLALWTRVGLGLSRSAAWLAGAIWVLGGYLGAQIEHLNQVQAAAWLPWLLLGYDRARLGQRGGVTVGVAALALSLLAGHAQSTFLALVVLALWALRHTGVETLRLRAGVVRAHRTGLYTREAGPIWRAYLGATLVPLLPILGLGALIAAVQLWPTQALAALSPRAAGLTFREAAAFSLDPRLLPRALLPAYGLDEPLFSEYVAWVGLLPLLLALLGAFRGRRAARDFGLITAGVGLFLAFGGYNPLFWPLWRLVPGFDLFRVPARWLLLWSLGLAVLAGAGLDLLRAGWRPEMPARPQVERRTLGGGAVLLLGAVIYALVADWPEMPVPLLWPLLAGAAALLIAARRWWPALTPRRHVLMVATLVVVELWVAGRGQLYQSATAPEAYSGLRPAPAHLIAAREPLGGGRLLSLSDLTWDPGDLAALETRHAGALGETAVYDLVISTKLKEVLAPNQPMRWGLTTADGYGGGLLPTARWVAFQPALPLAKVVPDGRLREQLTAIPTSSLLDVMGVEWLVADKVFDWWSGDVYHDLGAPLPLAAGSAARWSLPPTEATALSFVVIGPWPPRPGRLRVGARSLDLAEAVEVARRQSPRGEERHLRLSLEPPLVLDGFQIEAEDGWVLGGVTWVDDRLPAFDPLPADPALRATFSGDVKVYRRRDGPGRAWIVPAARRVAGPEAGAALLATGALDPRRAVAVEATGRGPLPEGGAGTVRWLQDDPERIVLDVEVPDGGWLLLADAPLPGWEVQVNGTPTQWLAANVINRALYLPPGRHELRWHYEVPRLRQGGLLSGLGLLGLGLWLLLNRGRLRLARA